MNQTENAWHALECGLRWGLKSLVLSSSQNKFHSWQADAARVSQLVKAKKGGHNVGDYLYIVSTNLPPEEALELFVDCLSSYGRNCHVWNAFTRYMITKTPPTTLVSAALKRLDQSNISLIHFANHFKVSF